MYSFMLIALLFSTSLHADQYYDARTDRREHGHASDWVGGLRHHEHRQEPRIDKPVVPRTAPEPAPRHPERRRSLRLTRRSDQVNAVKNFARDLAYTYDAFDHPLTREDLDHHFNDEHALLNYSSLGKDRQTLLFYKAQDAYNTTLDERHEKEHPRHEKRKRTEYDDEPNEKRYHEEPALRPDYRDEWRKEDMKHTRRPYRPRRHRFSYQHPSPDDTRYEDETDRRPDYRREWREKDMKPQRHELHRIRREFTQQRPRRDSRVAAAA